MRSQLERDLYNNAPGGGGEQMYTFQPVPGGKDEDEEENPFRDTFNDDLRQSMLALNKEQNIKTAKDLYEYFKEQKD